jgi:hypothetical protein
VNDANVYMLLIKRLLGNEISINKFRKLYFDKFVNEQLDEQSFLILDKFYGDVEAFTTDESLIVKYPKFYINEATLREKASETLQRLNMLLKNIK